MSCTHDCGCTPEIRDARTDEWVQIVPESARPATLTPEQTVKAPGQDGDLFLTRGTVVEVEWSNGSRTRRYVDEGGYQLLARFVGNGDPHQWGDERIVRVLAEEKPAQEPVLPRRKTLYVSGPMTGLPDFNRAAFHKAADDLRARGYDVVNPAEVDLGPKATWEDYMRVHLATITSGDVHGLAMLPGWRKSKGARLEGDVARAFGLPMRWCHDWPVIEDAPEPVDPDAEVARLTAERDALAAQVARVEEVLDHWRTVDEGNAAYAERIGERSRFADGLASRADMLRAALAGSEADTSDTQPTDPGCGCSTNPARARYADGDPAGCYCTCSDDAREGCEHEPDEPQPTGLEVK